MSNYPRYPDLSDRPRRTPEQEAVERQLRAAEANTRALISRLWPFAIVIVVALWVASGIYTVQPGEVGVVRNFGLEVGRTQPGLNYRLPWPIQQVDIVNVEAIRRAEIGFRSAGGQITRVNTEALMLTGDENIVEAQMIVQYRVSDPSKYLFRLRDPDDALHTATEVALRSAIGKMKIDDVLTTGRGDAQERTRLFLQALLDTYDSGLHVTDAKLQVVDPPEQVKDAFQEVVRAREDRERLTNESRAYREDILPRARGQAQETIRAAEAYKEQRVIQANGDVAKFAAVLQEYLKSKEVTRDRLHLETVERILSKVDKIVLDPNVSGNTTPILPLRGFEGAAAQPVTAAVAAQAAAPQPAAQPTATAPRPPAQPTAPAKTAPSRP